MLIEQAGGKASTGTQRILDIVPTKLHMYVHVCVCVCVYLFVCV
jgi:fructose-1,6-bisphosphatase